MKLKKLSGSDLPQIITLYKDAGWWEPSFGQGEFIPPMLRGSTVAIGAFENEELIGMGRAISDGVSDAYIQDVVVLKKCRGGGVGKKIVEEIIRRLQKRGIDWIGLISTPGSEGFYRTMNFEVMPRHSPMLLLRSITSAKD